MTDFRLYAEIKHRGGYCRGCIEHSKLSPHMIGKSGDRCPMCDANIYTIKPDAFCVEGEQNG